MGKAAAPHYQSKVSRVGLDFPGKSKGTRQIRNQARKLAWGLVRFQTGHHRHSEAQAGS